MMNDYISLYEVTPETGGIFSALDSFQVPWKDEIDPDLLDLQYYGNVSGEKTISPLVYKNLDENGKLTVSKQSLIASMIFKLYGANWIKEWATMSKQYDPIANYDMTEIMEDDETVIEYGKTEDTTTGNTHTKTGTETDTPDVTITTEDSIYGFNSSSASNSNKRVEDPSGTNETEYDLSETDNGSVGLEQGGSDTHTRNYTLTRKGNIGVTTSQQLLQAERDLWMWNYFNDVVFPDVDRVMTIPLYAESTGYSGSSGGVTPTGTIYITENGNRIDVASFAYANVNVPNSYSAADEGKVVSDGALVAQTGRTITENGTYDTTENNQVMVNVPNSYSAADEGKVVSDGALVAQTERSITENGTYDTTENNSVIVDILSSILSGTSEPTSVIGSNGQIYLQYEDGSILPSGYTLLESVEFTGAQSIDTGILTSTQDLRVVSKIAIPSIATMAIWGGSWNASGFFLMIYGNKFRWHSRGVSIDSAVLTAYEWYEIETNKSALIVEGNEYPLPNPTGTDVSVNLQIGSVLSAQGANAYMKLKRTKIYNGSTLLADLIPAKDSNDVACLYDAVRNTTLYSNGTNLVANEALAGSPIDSAYLKVNGSWQSLIGSDIDDVNH